MNVLCAIIYCGKWASPTLPPLWLKIIVFTPMTSPFAFTRGPPLLPGLIAASV